MATTLNVDDMKSKLVGGGARPNLFKVVPTWPSGVPHPTGDTASFMIKMASLPGSTIANIEVPFRGRKLQVAGDRTFDPWSITVINDNDFKIRNAFESWMRKMNDHVENTGEMDPARYYSTFTVIQLDKQGNDIRTYEIHGIFPTSLSPIELDYGAESTIEEFTVEFQVQYWTNDKSTPKVGGKTKDFAQQIKQRIGGRYGL
jgi:hypothetical protein